MADENGLIYMRARYYSPEMRRFINADILHGQISDSTSLNRYSYVNGNPASFVDPFWLAEWWQTALKVTAVVAVVAGLAVVTVATAGTATAVIAGGALAGAAVGGAIGAASGYATRGIDGAVDGMFVGTLSGAASGALVARGASATAVEGCYCIVFVALWLHWYKALADNNRFTDTIYTPGASVARCPIPVW